MAAIAAPRARRTLTAEQHARIRRHLWLIPTYVWLVYGWKDLLLTLPLGIPGADVHLARDFVQFYLQGLIANLGDARALYDIDRWAAMLPDVVRLPDGVRYPPVYGPQLSVFFSPFARLAYSRALTLWIVVSLVTYLACAYAVWRGCPRLRAYPAMVAVLLVADPALHYTLSFSQASPIGLVCVTAALVALRANRPFVAGLAIGSLVYKPQLGIAAAVVFLAAGEWRIVAGAILGAALQFGAACVFWGVSILGDYARSLQRLAPTFSEQFEPFRYQMHSLRPFFELIGLPNDAAFGAYIAASVVVLACALRVWRGRGPLALRYSALLAATILVDPHVYAYDLIMLMPAYLLVWDWSFTQPRGTFTSMFRPLLYVCYFSPLFVAVAVLAHIQVSVVALACVFAALCKAGWSVGADSVSNRIPGVSEMR